jgi:hypothetical protein
MSERNVATLVSEVDRARQRLYVLLRSKDGRVLSKRPASGEWSIVENVRLLVFAEQVHLGKFLPDGRAWSPMNLTQRRRKTFTVKGGVVAFRRHERQLVAEHGGTEPKEELAEVFRAWDVIHQPIRKAVKAEGEDAQYALERHLGHLLRHVEVIEKQLAWANKQVAKVVPVKAVRKKNTR